MASLLLLLCLAYDVFWVFIQPLFSDGTSVMVEVSTGNSFDISGITATRQQAPKWSAYVSIGGTKPARPCLTAELAWQALCHPLAQGQTLPYIGDFLWPDSLY